MTAAEQNIKSTDERNHFEFIGSEFTTAVSFRFARPLQQAIFNARRRFTLPVVIFTIGPSSQLSSSENVFRPLFFPCGGESIYTVSTYVVNPEQKIKSFYRTLFIFYALYLARFYLPELIGLSSTRRQGTIWTVQVSTEHWPAISFREKKIFNFKTLVFV